MHWTSAFGNAWCAAGKLAVWPLRETCRRPLVVAELAAELAQKMLDILEMDVGADGMGEKAVQDLAMTMVHVVFLLAPASAHDRWLKPTRMNSTVLDVSQHELVSLVLISYTSLAVRIAGVVTGHVRKQSE
ncbi:MAG: hypothetical protein R3C97_14850 [Geminicoccaceae bacterium]